MKGAYFILLAALYAGLPGHAFSLFERDTNTCPCSETLDCAPKYQIIPGHTACLQKHPEANPVELTTEDKRKIVDLHNNLRGKITPVATNMQKLIWDDELEMIARKKGDSCSFGYDELRNIPGRYSVGQALAGGQNNFEEVIQVWNNEKVIYELQKAKNVFHGFGPIEYIQLYWADTNRVGCAVTNCYGANNFFCYYAPAANLSQIDSLYETGTQRCSKCKKCDENGLCDCGDVQCFNGGKLDTKTCTCICENPQVNSGPNCEVNCANQDMEHCNRHPSFIAENCHQFRVSSACPHMCKYCSCGERQYC